MNSFDYPSVAATTSQVSRRTIVKGAAWSLPVIAAAATLPSAAASAAFCPALRYYWGGYAHYEASNLQSRRWWTASSSSTIVAGFGNYAAGGYPALSMTSPESVQVQLISLTYTYTFSFAVDWSAVPSGWTLTGSSSSAGSWTYVFTYDASGQVAVIASDTAPGSVVVPKAMATGDIDASTVAIGTDVTSAAFENYTVTIDVAYAPTFENSPGCVSADGDDGAVRVRQQTMTIRMNQNT